MRSANPPKATLLIALGMHDHTVLFPCGRPPERDRHPLKAHSPFRLHRHGLQGMLFP